MTPSQESAVKRIREYVEREDLLRRPDKYEVKSFEVEELSHGIVTVYSETGLNGDEGTMAEVFCRTKRHIFIGKRGGLHCYKWDKEAKKSTDLWGWSDVMIFGGNF